MKTNTENRGDVQSVKVKGITIEGNAPVYNMEVMRHHNFSIFGGLIVHNCVDAMRYMTFTVIKSGGGMSVLK